MVKTEEKITILNYGIKQREAALNTILIAQSEHEKMSDFGWFLTLGSEAIGMLAAVESGKKARMLDGMIRKLENEIDILQNAIDDLRN